MMNGYGTLEFKNGEKYVGDFVNDKAHGKGKHTWPSGEYYEGDYFENV